MLPADFLRGFSLVATGAATLAGLGFGGSKPEASAALRKVSADIGVGGVSSSIEDS
jgi:hypothetical protein